MFVTQEMPSQSGIIQMNHTVIFSSGVTGVAAVHTMKTFLSSDVLV